MGRMFEKLPEVDPALRKALDDLKKSKTIYLEKLRIIRNLNQILISKTFAGSVKVSLESIEETLTKLHDKIDNMTEEQFKLVSD